MLKLNNVFINENMVDIVEAVQQELGIFTDIIYGNNIMVTCPFHKGGQETHPSMGIATELVDGIETGYCACFSCTWRGSFAKLLEEVMGLDEGEGEEWLLNRYNPYIAKKKTIPTIEKRKAIEQQMYLDPKFLDGFQDYHPYLGTRGISRESAQLFNLRYSSIENAILFPVRDVQGRILYVSHRKIDEKRFKIPKGAHKGLYGVYEARLTSTSNEILVVESAFNAISATQWGRPAVALFGLGTDSQFEAIAQLPYYRIVLAFDPDEAGYKAQEKLALYLQGRKMVGILELPTGKDVNDLTRDEFLNLPEYNFISKN